MNEHAALGCRVLCSYIRHAKYWSSPIGDQLPPAKLTWVWEFEFLDERGLFAQCSGGRTSPMNEHAALGCRV
jgi:hypothetical protein